MNRRRFAALTAAAALVPLAGCAVNPRYSLAEAIRRLLTLSAQRAFDTLLAPGGFYDSGTARIVLPPELGGPGASSALAAALRFGPVKDRLAFAANRAAARGAERAAPVLADAVLSFSIEDAAAIVGGGSAAATEALERALGRSLVGVMFPVVDDTLRLAETDAVAQALRLVTGFDVASLARTVADQSHAILYRTIAAQEAAVRADPAATRDPLLIAAFGAARLRQQ